MNNEKEVFDSSSETAERSDSTEDSLRADSQEAFRQRVHQVIGPEMAESPSFADAANQKPNTKKLDQSRDRAVEVPNEGWNLAIIKLQNIKDLVAELVSRNLEHRVEDVRDNIVILGSMRSHKLASREGELIDQLKLDIADLQLIIRSNGLDLDISELITASEAFKKPAGFTKGFATVFPNWRRLHRSFTTPRAEALKTITTNLLRVTQDKVYPSRNRQMAA